MKVTVVSVHTQYRRGHFRVKEGFRQKPQESFPVKKMEGDIEGGSRAEEGQGDVVTCRLG